MDIYSFKATVTKELYYNRDNNFGVYVFTSNDKIPHLEKPKRAAFEDMYAMQAFPEAILSGPMQKLQTGQQYSVKAEVKKHAKYGWQFIPLQLSMEKPTDIEGTIIFLTAVCTKKQAEDIVRLHPKFIDEVIAGKREFSVGNIKIAKMHQIITHVEENYVISDIMVMLTPLGVTYKMIQKITNDIPNTQLLKETLHNNPYILTRIHGLGFKRVDELALKINPALIDSEERARSLITYFMNQKGMDEGHSMFPESELRMTFAENAKEATPHLSKLLADENLIKSYQSQVGLKSHYINESIIWDKAVKMSKNATLSPKPNYNIKTTEEKMKIEFTEEQRNAILSTVDSNFIVITGAAGTGKSTVVQGILDMYEGYEIGICALAAKAAQRIYEITGFPAMTIHRILEWKGSFFERNASNPLEEQIIILDEASMVNSWLFKKLFEAIPINAKFIIIFDHAQLPPIGIGNIATDLLKAGDILKINKFTQVHRQAQRSGILSDANMIRTGVNPVPRLKAANTGELKDMWYVFENDRKKIQEIIVDTFFKAIKTNKIDDVVVIVPRKKGVANSTTEINMIIHDRLFDKYIPHVKYGKKVLSQGAKVIQRVNNYEKEVINGEIGFIENIDEQSKKFTVKFTEEKTVEFIFEEAKDIELAYALTVHSYQGSQSNVVIIGIDWTHYILLDNCLLYTAITRASKQCAIIAESKAFSYAIKQNKNRERRTFLSRIINNGLLPYLPEEHGQAYLTSGVTASQVQTPNNSPGAEGDVWTDTDDMEAPF
jgi:exodeoxyribonuclease V alpha subunit